MRDSDDIFDDDIIKRILEENNRPISDVVNDLVRKEVGDRVMVLDYLTFTKLSGEPLTKTESNNLNDKDYYIVIGTDKKCTFSFKNREYRQDLIIVNPKTNEQFRVNSKHVIIHVI